MKTEQQIKALAELDGWTVATTTDRFGNRFWRRIADVLEQGKQWLRVGDYPKTHEPLPNYLTSYDAIIPLIQKQPREVRATIGYGSIPSGAISFMSTPAQLCEALLRATRKWTE